MPMEVLEVEQDLSMAVPKKDEDEVRVLFVEDDPAVAQMYRLKLELDGYLVEIATDGEQAVTFLVRVKERIEAPERMLLEV